MIKQKFGGTLLAALVLFAGLAFLSSCEDTPVECEGVVCLNGGECYVDALGQPQCDCPEGFSGPACEDDETACIGIVCQNGGTCFVDALGQAFCDCPPGYSGPNCEAFDPCSICESYQRCNDAGDGCVNVVTDMVGFYNASDACTSDNYAYSVEITADTDSTFFIDGFGGFDAPISIVKGTVLSETSWEIASQTDAGGRVIESTSLGSWDRTNDLLIINTLITFGDGSTDACTLTLEGI